MSRHLRGTYQSSQQHLLLLKPGGQTQHDRLRGSQQRERLKVRVWGVWARDSRPGSIFRLHLSVLRARWEDIIQLWRELLMNGSRANCTFLCTEDYNAKHELNIDHRKSLPLNLLLSWNTQEMRELHFLMIYSFIQKLEKKVLNDRKILLDLLTSYNTSL